MASYRQLHSPGNVVDALGLDRRPGLLTDGGGHLLQVLSGLLSSPVSLDGKFDLALGTYESGYELRHKLRRVQRTNAREAKDTGCNHNGSRKMIRGGNGRGLRGDFQLREKSLSAMARSDFIVTWSAPSPGKSAYMPETRDNFIRYQEETVPKQRVHLLHSTKVLRLARIGKSGQRARYVR